MAKRKMTKRQPMIYKIKKPQKTKDGAIQVQNTVMNIDAPEG
jgi:hypothetical protein